MEQRAVAGNRTGQPMGANLAATADRVISENYRAINNRLHAERADYGAGGHKWAGVVRELARAIPATTILDYGCGKRTLERELGFGIANYDPALVEFAAPPEPADLVVCTDVLEHIEPECLDAVLDDLRRCTLQAGLFVIATRPAKKTLPDGRNTHLIQRDLQWWFSRLWERWRVQQLIDFNEREFMIALRVRPC